MRLCDLGHSMGEALGVGAYSPSSFFLSSALSC